MSIGETLLRAEHKLLVLDQGFWAIDGESSRNPGLPAEAEPGTLQRGAVWT